MGERYRIAFDANGLPSRVRDEDGTILEFDYVLAALVAAASSLHVERPIDLVSSIGVAWESRGCC